MQTYKVFHERHYYSVKITSEAFFNADLASNPVKYDDSEIKKILKNWLEKPNRIDLIFDCDLKTLHQAESSVFHFVEAAGGVVLVDGKMLTIVRHGIPDLPKGHLKKSETAFEGAIREVAEEITADDLIIVEPLPSTYHCYKQKGKWLLKKTYWYVMTTKQQSGFKPQYSEGITAIEFFEPERISSFLDKTFRSINETLGSEIIRLLKQHK